MWMTGYDEDEIAAFASIPVEDVKKDLMYVNTRLPVRQIIQHNNDRMRIMIQRQESEKFRKLMHDTLEVPAVAMFTSGISPAGIMKEFREATGMVQKAEPLLQINTQVNNTSNSHSASSITSAEDVIRRVLGEINQNTLAQTQSDDSETVDAEVVGSEEDRIPDEDD